MIWKKKTEVDTAAHALFEVLAERMKVDGRIRAEDLITALASIVGESCISVAGDFNPREHEFVPGARIFSSRINELFSGDLPDATIYTVPTNSIVGMLRDRLIAGGYSKSDFPVLKTIFEHFAANIGTQSDWGKVPLSVPDKNRPFILPLRIAYETRPIIDQIFQPLSSAEDRLRAAVFALAEALIAVNRVIDKKTAVLLAVQTVNGMAKTAPMTDEAMKSLQK